MMIKGSYPKTVQSLDLGRGVTVRGEMPFEGRLDGDAIRIKADGRTRVLYVTKPPFIIRPQLWIDGQEWMASWTDYPASGWGTYKDAQLMALSVPAGQHELVVKDFRVPAGWARPWKPMISDGRK